MKNLLILLPFLILLQTSCSDFEKIEVKGKVRGLTEAVISLKKADSVVLSANIIDGEFLLKGIIPRADFYQLTISKNGEWSNFAGYLIYADDDLKSIAIDTTKLLNYPSVSSKAKNQQDVEAFYKESVARRQAIEDKYHTAKSISDSLQVPGTVEEYNAAIDVTNKYHLKLVDFDHEAKLDFAGKNPDSELSAYFLANMYEKYIERDPAAHMKVFKAFSNTVVSSVYGRKANKLVSKYSNGVRGSILPQIYGTDINGKSFDQSKLIGKATLVVFWRTLNSESVEDIGRLKKLYNSYRSRGLQIVAISFDSKRERWEKFLEEYHLPWINLYDDLGIKSPNIKNFGNTNLPYYFLADVNQKILERDVPLDDILFEGYFRTAVK